MKAIEFDETQIEELEKIAYKLFEDEFDPRSNAYKRKMIRPRVNWIGLFFWVTMPVLCAIVLLCFCDLSNIKTWHKVRITFLLGIVYIIATAKWVAISIIKIYQRYAPKAVRLKCRFEPSCSEYMIQAIEKYGLMKGMKRGVNRLRRCNINGGGFDEP